MRDHKFQVGDPVIYRDVMGTPYPAQITAVDFDSHARQEGFVDVYLYHSPMGTPAQIDGIPAHKVERIGYSS
jgi:hypothetical protein